MHEALHPYKMRLIGYSDYVKLAADKGYQIPNNWLGGRCPVCKRRMNVRGGHKKDDGHFYHIDSDFCPTKDPSARPYISKIPTQIDAEAEARNERFAREHINEIWGRLNEMVPFLDFKEFILIIEQAKKLRVYGYVNLEPSFLPYVYATLINFLPSKSKGRKRKLKFCFFFESSVKGFDELWIDRGENSKFLRISYDGTDAKKVSIYDLEKNYLDRGYYPLSQAQTEWVLDKI